MKTKRESLCKRSKSTQESGKMNLVSLIGLEPKIKDRVAKIILKIYRWLEQILKINGTLIHINGSVCFFFDHAIDTSNYNSFTTFPKGKILKLSLANMIMINK